MNNNSPLQSTRNTLMFVVICLFPLFIFPFLRDYLILSKYYFFLYGMILIAAVGFLYVITTKRIVIHKNPFSGALLLLLVAVVMSTLITAPNTIQALLSARFGFLLMASLVLFFLFLTQLFETRKQTVFMLVSISATIVSFLSILAALRPLRSFDLGAYAFLDSPSFNLVGSSIEIGIFLGLAVIMLVMSIIKTDKKGKNENTTSHVQHHGARKGNEYKQYDLNPLYFISLIIISIALCLQIYFVIKATVFDEQTLLLTPWQTSWYAAIEILKNPLTALFGAGVNNFAAIFTQSKDVSYNMTELWQVTAFNVSRSAVLHIITVGGLLAGIALLMIVLKVFQTFRLSSLTARLFMGYGTLVLLLWPPSPVTYVIFFICLAYYAYDVNQHNVADTYIFDFTKIMPLYITVLVVFALTLGFSGYFITNAFISEILYGKSIHAVQQNDLKKLYESQRAAIQLNPYNEDFRRDFSQTNLLIANNFSSKDPDEITDQDRQAITQSIQASIAEAKAAVSLNSENALNWQHLASTYKSILSVADGSADWSVAAYQQAIRMDPQNPSHRLELGGIYYLAQEYEQAERLFEQATSLKPDWSNAYYNLAWTYYQIGEYEKAVETMQQVITLIDAEEQAEDLAKAQEDLDTFREQADQQDSQPTDESAPEQEEAVEINEAEESSLQLPQEEGDNPIINLPDESAPPEEGEVEEIDLNTSEIDLDQTEFNSDDFDTVPEEEILGEQDTATDTGAIGQ